MPGYELSSVTLRTGITIQRSTEILVRETVEFGDGSSVFYPGDKFTISSLEFVPADEDIVVGLDEGPLDFINWGRPTESGLCGLIEKGKFVVIS